MSKSSSSVSQRTKLSQLIRIPCMVCEVDSLAIKSVKLVIISWLFYDIRTRLFFFARLRLSNIFINLLSKFESCILHSCRENKQNMKKL